MADLILATIHDSYIDLGIAAIFVGYVLASQLLHAIARALSVCAFIVRALRHDWKEVCSSWSGLVDSTKGPHGRNSESASRQDIDQ